MRDSLDSGLDVVQKFMESMDMVTDANLGEGTQSIELDKVLTLRTSISRTMGLSNPISQR